MFKLVVLSALFAVAIAAPSHHEFLAAPALASVRTTIPLTTYRKEVIPGSTHVEVHPRVQVVEQPYVAKVAEHVERVPTAISHQSSTIVHNSADIRTPIYAHGVQKSVVPAEPLVKTYQTPSIVKTYAEPSAITLEHQAPLAYSHSYGAYGSYGFPSAYYAAPAAYHNNYYNQW